MLCESPQTEPVPARAWLPDIDAAFRTLLATGWYRVEWDPLFPVRLERFRRELRARAQAAQVRIETTVRPGLVRPLLIATLPQVVRTAKMLGEPT